MEPFELIFNSDSEKGIHSGGFSVNSIMMRKGISPIKTWNVQNENDHEIKQEGGMQVSDLFKSLVVPNWAYANNTVGGNHNDFDNNSDSEEEEDFINEDLHDKLLKLVEAKDAEAKDSETKTKTKTKTNIEIIKKKNITKKINNNQGGKKKTKKIKIHK
jgi:hypothetical protein